MVLSFLFYLDQDSTQGELSPSDGMRECQLDGSMGNEDGTAEKDIGDQELNDCVNELSGIVHGERAKNDLDASSSVDVVELRGIKRSSECDEQPDSKKFCTITLDSDGEGPNAENKPLNMEEATKLDGQIISSSESDSDDSDDSDADRSVNARYAYSYSFSLYKFTRAMKSMHTRTHKKTPSSCCVLNFLLCNSSFLSFPFDDLCHFTHMKIY